MVNSADQSFFTAVGVRFGSYVDTDTMRSDNTTGVEDNANDHEHVSLDRLIVNQYHH
jgi:hypothetical protein